MKIGRVHTDAGDTLVAPGQGGTPAPLLGRSGTPYTSWREFFEDPAGGQAKLGTPLPPDSYRWLPPVENPQKIFGIGLNYADHARETNATVGEIPVIFNKFPSALSAHQATIELPAISQQVDFEAELVVVIGRGGRHIPLANAREHIFGYCCGNDVSARDWQKGKPGGQWLLGKSFDTFAPCGPWLTTADEIAWPVELEIELTINGQTMQSSNTRQLIFGLDFLIAHLSQFCTLQPGDLIFTGTPSGVGVARTPPRFLAAGDRVEVTIAQLGSLSNQVVGA